MQHKDMKNKLLFVFALLCANLFSLQQAKARIIYLNTEGIGWTEFRDATQVWVQFWQYPSERGDLFLPDGTKKEMYKVVDHVWAVEIGDLEHYTHLLFSYTDIINGLDWEGNPGGDYSGKTIDLELPYYCKGDLYSNNCFFMSSTDWQSEAAWGVQPFRIKYGWNGAETWTYKDLIHNGDGTYSLIDQYGDNLRNCDIASNGVGSEYVEGVTIRNTPTQGDRCTFTFKPDEANKDNKEKWITITNNSYYYLKHPWYGDGGNWVWSDELTYADDNTYYIYKRYGGDQGFNWNTSKNNTGQKWIERTTYAGNTYPRVTHEGNPQSGDYCKITLYPKANSNKGAITVTKCTEFYLKHNWGGGLWAWTKLNNNGDGTYSTIRRWGNAGCNFNTTDSNIGNEWIDYNPSNPSSTPNFKVYPDPETGMSPNVGDFCKFTLDPIAHTMEVQMLGHELVDEETWKVYFTCAYNGDNTYYWGSDYASQANVYAHMWQGGYKNKDWPGELAKYCGQNEFGECVYMMPKKIYDYVIFSTGKSPDQGGHQTVDIQIYPNEVSEKGTPVGYFINGIVTSGDDEGKNTVATWNPKRAQPDPLNPRHMHYWICKNCDQYIYDSHDLLEGCLKCSRLDLVNTEVPTKLNTGKYETVNLNRTFKVGYSTVALPFDVTNVPKVFGNGAFVADFESGCEPWGEGEGYVLRFVNKTSMVANHPYILCAAAEKAAPVFNDVTVVAREPMTINGSNTTRDNKLWTMSSNYTVGKNMGGLYGVATNKAIKRGSSTATLNAYAAYMEYFGEGTPLIRAWEDELEDGVILIKNEELRMRSEESVYDLSGRKVGTMDNGQLKKGIYIVNGKKVVR